jgi:D-lyxose ketol-isomerase
MFRVAVPAVKSRAGAGGPPTRTAVVYACFGSPAILAREAPVISRAQHRAACAKALELFARAGIVLTPGERESIEIADFGLGDLDRVGLALLVYVNTARVCAKELALLPNQICPEHHHPTRHGVPGKEETFRCRFGTVYLYVPGAPGQPRLSGLDPYRPYLTMTHEIVLNPGEQYTLVPDTPHWFRAGDMGAVVSEFSTTSTDEADIFTDPRIERITRVE